MGGGGLLQLVAIGAQDLYLTSQPSITFWRSIYRRYTAFALESIPQQWNGNPGLGKRVTTTISRNGDLISGLVLQVDLKKSVANGVAHYPVENLVSELEVELGGQRIEKVYSDFARIYDELFRTGTEKEAYKAMCNFIPGCPDGTVQRFYYPITVWFTRNPGSACPIISLQYHELKIHLLMASSVPGIDPTHSGIADATLFVDYAFLDVSERRRFATVSHEYLITQCQHSGIETVAPKAGGVAVHNVRLSFNHPTRYIAFVIRNGNTHGRYTALEPGSTDELAAPLLSARLQINGHDRQSTRSGSWYNRVVPYQCASSKPAAGIYMYSFSLRPNESQPSGSINFSRIDSSVLILELKKTTKPDFANVLTEEETYANVEGNCTNLLVFAESFNILRILSGMGGLAYSS
jgi:hypothetical protein